MTDDHKQRLLEDHERLQHLREVSGGRFDFRTGAESPPEQYLVTMRCQGLYLNHGVVSERSEHQLQIELSPGYPDTPPGIVWRTPIYHPNIIGWDVCLLGHWGARTHLDDVCIWLWDMVRYRLYNIDDAHDMNAGRWAAQHKHLFPLDAFDLRAAAAAPAQPPVRDDQELADSIVLQRDAEA